MENISWIEDIIESTHNIPFFNTFSVDMARFSNPHKVVVQRNAFSILASAKNESVLKMKMEKFGHGRLEHPLSQIEENLDLQEIFKSAPFPKKILTRKKMIVITIKKKYEESKVVKIFE
jgi:hypothetical protein